MIFQNKIPVTKAHKPPISFEMRSLLYGKIEKRITNGLFNKVSTSNYQIRNEDM